MLQNSNLMVSVDKKSVNKSTRVINTKRCIDTEYRIIFIFFLKDSLKYSDLFEYTRQVILSSIDE